MKLNKKIKGLLIINLLLVISCSSMNTTGIAPGYAEAFKAIRNAVFGFESNLISPELIRNIPYASLSLRIGKGPKGLLILESTNNDIDTWVSADGVYILTDKGKIIQTAGLEHNLIDLASQNSSYNNISIKEPQLFNDYYSYDVPYHRNLKTTVGVFRQKKEIIELFDRQEELTLIEEVVINEKIGWEVKNKYWVDDNNYVWKSIQHISPRLPPFEIEVTKKPSR